MMMMMNVKYQYSMQDCIRSVFGGKESKADEEQQQKGLEPSQLSSVTLLPNATDDELAPQPFLNYN